MNRRYGKLSSLFQCLSFAGVMFVTAGCGEGPGNPRPPQSPPRPVTEEGRIAPANLILNVLPVPPKPGMM